MSRLIAGGVEAGFAERLHHYRQCIEITDSITYLFLYYLSRLSAEEILHEPEQSMSHICLHV